jgi:putative transposase
MATSNKILLEPNGVYHIFAHAVHANDFFYDNENKRFFLEKWKHFSKGYFKTYAYCLLSNHFHFCIHVEKEPVLLRTIADKLELELGASSELSPSSNSNIELLLSKQINNFLSSYTQSLNKQRNRKGTLVRERYGRIRVESRAYLKDLICYIHHNPIHHFNVDNYDEWLYSSYNSYILTLENDVLQKENIMLVFGGIPQFIEYHRLYKESKRFVSMEKQILEEFSKK